jgi:hypothetical protein
MEIGDYLALVPNYHSTLPRFMNTVALLTQPLADAQDMLERLRADFDIDTAIGVQLDQVGQWVGRTRYVQAPITGIFFSFDLPAQRVGFDQGFWLGQYTPTDAITALDDETYRSILKLQVLANQWDGTLASISIALNTVFPGIAIQDLGDTGPGLMSMHVLLPLADMDSLLLAVLEQDFPIKPSGVRMDFIDNPIAGGQPVFAFDVPHVLDGPLGGWEGGLPSDQHSAWGIIVFTA